jgi:hypothetical protein
MDMPQGWFERAAPQHGREFRSYDPSIPLPGNYSSEGLPPVGDVLVRMQMQANPDKLDAATFFKVPDPREVGVQVREHKQATVAGRPPSSGRSGGANRRSSSVRSRRSGGTCAVPSSTIGWS